MSRSERVNSSSRLVQRRGPGTERDEPAAAAASFEVETDVDPDDRTVPRAVLICAFLQIFLTSFYYTVVIPTSRQYAESLDAPKGFDGIMVGAVAVGAAVFNYPYRWMLRKSFSLTMFFQIICMQVGSLLYSLAQVANKLELVVAGRLLGGCGASVYPVYQFVAEEVGKNKRSEVISLISGFGKSLGFALGPISAATFAYVDFSIGEMDVDKDTNPGWIVAIMCLFQSFLVLIVFPRRGSKLIGKDKVSLDLGENAGAQTWRERALRFATLGFIILAIALANAFLSAWQIAATNVIQISFKWSLQWSAVLVGGISFTPAFVAPVLGNLSKRFEDRRILLAGTLAQLVGSALVFDYNSPVTYLIGSFILFNGYTAEVIFMCALASKVAHVSEVDTVMSCIGWTTILRAPGFVLGTYLTINQVAVSFASGSLFLLFCTLGLWKKLVPTLNGV